MAKYGLFTLCIMKKLKFNCYKRTHLSRNVVSAENSNSEGRSDALAGPGIFEDPRISEMVVVVPRVSKTSTEPKPCFSENHTGVTFNSASYCKTDIVLPSSTGSFSGNFEE